MTASGWTPGFGRQPGASSSTTASPLRRLSVAAVLLVVLAGNLPASSLADSSAAANGTQGRFNFSNAAIAGQLSLSDATQAALLLPSSKSPAAELSIELEARNLVVNVTTSRWILVGTAPDDPSDAAFSIAKGPPEYEEFSHSDAFIQFSSAPNFSQLLAVFDEAQISGSFSNRVEIWPADGNPWRAGFGGNSSIGSGGDPGSTRTVSVPAGFPSLHFGSTALAVLGSLEIIVWDAEFLVENASGGVHSYRSGSTQQPLAQGVPPQADAVARERIDRLVSLRAENASAHLFIAGRQAALAAPVLALSARGDAEFYAPHGYLSNAAGRMELVGDPLGVAGEFSLALSSRPDDHRALSGDIAIGPGTVLLGENAMLHKPSTSSRSIWRPGGASWPVAAVSAGLAAAAAIGMFALAGLARRWQDRGIAIDDAELSLLGGKTRTAIRQARAILRRDALDADAMFVLGAAQLKAGKLSNAVRELGRRCRALPIGERRGVAFLLALAGLRLGRPDSVRQWAAEAKRDPILAFRLGEEGWPEEAPDEDRAYA